MTSGPLLIDAGSLVVSGAAIDLNAREHSMTLNTFWKAPQVPFNPTGSSYNLRLPQAQYTGIEPPTHQISGFYDDTGRGYNNSTSLADNGAYFITGSMLKGIALSGSVFALVDSEVIQASNFGSGSMVYVVPTSYNLSRANINSAGDGTVGYQVDYSITFTEIQV